MALNDLDDIKAAIERLSEPERHGLHSWWVASFSSEIDHSDSYPTRVVGDHVARNPAAAYGASVVPQRLSVDEYLEFEANSEGRHEYIDGVVYAMSGAREKHELIAGNLFAAFHGHLRGGPSAGLIDARKGSGGCSRRYGRPPAGRPFLKIVAAIR
jgi:hypothetical protein